MKFKKGDMVKVITRQNPWGWNPKMQKMLDNGSCYPVGAVQIGGAEIVVHHGDDGFSFPPSSLEHVDGLERAEKKGQVMKYQAGNVAYAIQLRDGVTGLSVWENDKGTHRFIGLNELKPGLCREIARALSVAYEAGSLHRSNEVRKALGI